MKKFGGTFLCVLALLCLAGCGNSVGEENQKYGSLRSNISVSGKGTQVMNKSGAVSLSSTTCEGTGVTIFVQ